MNDTNYKMIAAALDKRIADCNKYLGQLKTTEDFKKLTIREAQELKDFCIKESNEMTAILMVDLYHIVGMGKLSPVQMMKFIYKIQEYSSFRSDLKTIASYLDRITVLPNIPTKSKFTLMALCNLTLYSHDEAGSVEEPQVHISDFSEAKKVIQQDPEQPHVKTRFQQFYDAKTKKLTITGSSLAEAATKFKFVSKSKELTVDQIMDKIKTAAITNGNIFGANWVLTDTNDYIGSIIDVKTAGSLVLSKL